MWSDVSMDIPVDARRRLQAPPGARTTGPLLLTAFLALSSLASALGSGDRRR